MKTLATTGNDYSTQKSAEIALKKLASSYRDEKYFNLLTWQVRPAPMDKKRFFGVGLIEEKNCCFECSRPMTNDEHNYGTPDMPVCIQCSELTN